MLPVVSVFASTSMVEILASFRKPIVVEALRLSAVTTVISTVIVVALGLPLAYTLARTRFWGREIIDTLVDLPMVLPPSVAGVALLMAFGRRGLLGQYLAAWGINITFTAVAVVMAQVFVAGPFFIRSARAGFAQVDPFLEQASLTLGKSRGQTFWRITLPLSFPSLLGGVVMAWARALGEFGATIMFAGNLPGRTQTLPLAVYTAMESDLEAALAISALMIGLSFGVLLAVRWLTRSGIGRRYEQEKSHA
ncbi:MAG: molybdate ABC transporter permease subunit [Clostridia bacterium]|nr:molybdate ABC transporter permease subunit [Clostridia bacterium]